MSFSAPQPSALIPALTFLERLAFWRHKKATINHIDIDIDKGQEWIGRIQSMPPFDNNPEIWSRFLVHFKLSQQDALSVLGLSPLLLAEHPIVTRLASALEESLTASGDDLNPITLPEHSGPLGGFLELSRPLLQQALRRLEREAPPGIYTYDQLKDLFLNPMLNVAYAASHRMLVLELNIARLEDRLEGESPDERFKSFIELLQKRSVCQSIFSDYPVLTRHVLEGLEQLTDAILEMLHRLEADRALLAATFFQGQDFGALEQITMSGDGHRGARRVLLLVFKDQRLVYKPHSLAVDVRFQQLLRWINCKGFTPEFRPILCLDRGPYGWCEFVEASDCNKPEQIKSFYQRQGSLLALLYAMLATDVHHENLIASGEYPVLVDLESLFHPHLKPIAKGDITQQTTDALTYSVLRTSMLPVPEFYGQNESPTDVSALSEVEGQQGMGWMAYVDMAVPDAARISRLTIEMKGSSNLPTLNGVKSIPSNHVNDLQCGFESFYRFLLVYRDEILQDDGPIDSFTGAEVRFIFRNTRSYGKLLHETLHPDLQRVALDRDVYFFRLWGILNERTDVAPLVESELESLWMGDIPYFHTETDSLFLYDHANRQFSGLLGQSCLSEVKRHLRQLGESDLIRQLWFIQGAMTCHEISLDQGWNRPRLSLGDVDIPSANLDAQYLLNAQRVGDRLVDLALVDPEGSHASWLGLIFYQEKVWRIMPLGMDLYNGLCGICLFLAYLHEITGTQSYLDLARAGVRTTLLHLEIMQQRISLTGAFGGWGGLVYTFSHLGRLWDDDELLVVAANSARQILRLAEEDQDFDVIHGNAGAILALDSLAVGNDDPTLALETMEACGRHLVKSSRILRRGRGWSSRIMASAPLAGFSHGAAGIAAALALLARRTGQSSYAAMADEAIAYERSLFDPVAGNWRDLRSLKPDADLDGKLPDHFPVAWCNGAPGIGMGRLHMGLDNQEASHDLDLALAATNREGFGLNHSICHGDLGNLDLLLECHRQAHPGVSQADIDRWGQAIMNGIEKRGWISGTPRGLESPGLLTGISGIGYQCLRLARPNLVPSVLMLTPPGGKIQLNRSDRT